MSKRRKQTKRPSSKSPRSRRAGAPYEDAICELFCQFDPTAEIHAGVWVEGPDGRRELDIDIIQNHGDRWVRGVVECKDFNPATTGPVGIAYVGQLDSKRRTAATVSAPLSAGSCFDFLAEPDLCGFSGVFVIGEGGSRGSCGLARQSGQCLCNCIVRRASLFADPVEQAVHGRCQRDRQRSGIVDPRCSLQPVAPGQSTQ